MSSKERTVGERVDPRITRTRQLLFKAFEELLAEKSLDAITVQDVADRATVNRATFYAHFEDKYDLLDQAFEETFTNALHKNLPPGSKFSSTNLQLLIQSTCEFLEHLHHHCAPANGTQLDSQLQEHVRQQLHDVLLEWVLPSGSSPAARRNAELRATITSWAIYGTCAWWIRGERKDTAKEFARRALAIIMAGLDPQVDHAGKGASREIVSGPR